MNLPTVVSREEWLVARKELLAKEKAATRAKDALNTKRRELPMVRVEKDYVFISAFSGLNVDIDADLPR